MLPLSQYGIAITQCSSQDGAGRPSTTTQAGTEPCSHMSLDMDSLR